MNPSAISQALQAFLPVIQPLQAEAPPPTQAGTGAADPGTPAPAVAAGLGGSLLTALETNPLASQLPPSLRDTLALSATALDFAPADAPAPVAPHAAAPEPAEPSHTLQQMAQVTAHVDIAAERHGTLAPPASADAPVPSPSVQPEPAVVPFARDVPLSPAVVPLLSMPAMHLRAEAAPLPPHERGGRQGGRGSPGDGEPEDPALSEAPHADAQPRALPAAADPEGSPQLYQRLVAALHALGGEDEAVARVHEELRRQRRVVLATPAGAVAGLRCAAHVDVLLPRHGGGRAVRLAGEVLWSHADGDTAWLEGHLVKSQGPGTVRQLVPVAAQVDPRRIAVCLGAQAVPMTAWSQACLRVRDGTRFWRALAPQWSLRVVIGRHPLLLTADAGGHHGG